MTSYLFILLGAVLVNNVVFVRILGLCPFMGVSKKLETAVGMGAATTFVLTLACGTSYVIDTWLLVPNDLQYLRTLSFIVTIAGHRPAHRTGDPEDQPAAAPGARHLPAADHHQLRRARRAAAQHRHASTTWSSRCCSASAARIGFTLALVLFAGIRERLEGADVPMHFRGTAIAMITAGIMSLAFMGFAGLDKYR